MRMLAQKLVDNLLEAVVPMLLAIGPGMPSDGFVMSGSNNRVLMLRFMNRNKLGGDDIWQADPDDLINQAVDKGYTLLFRTAEGNAQIFGTNPEKLTKEHFQQLNIKANASVGIGQKAPFIEKTTTVDDVTAEPEGNRTRVMSFGGVSNPPEGSVTDTKTVSVDRLRQGLKNGLRYVIKHPGGKVTFVTPDLASESGKVFNAAEANSIRTRFGIEDDTQVDWYIGSINPDAKGTVTFGQLLKH